LFPEIACRYEPSGEGWKTRWIVWGGGNLLESLGLVSRDPWLLRPDVATLDHFHRRLSAAKKGSSPRHQLEAHLTLCELIRLIHQAQERGSETPLIDKLKNELLRDLSAPVSIESLAAANQLSPAHLRRLFKKKTGLSPKPFLTSARMSRAQQLALEGHSIDKIAAQLGYADKFFFMRAFRSHTGTTLESFRKANRL
ncbi:MAG: helix-turn-helix transcriptional regulator, partial [Spirochaetia bacterium]|nr:helix-turn-helix transcriptional regulator [Spirochaetia bacterium]